MTAASVACVWLSNDDARTLGRLLGQPFVGRVWFVEPNWVTRGRLLLNSKGYNEMTGKPIRFTLVWPKPDSLVYNDQASSRTSEGSERASRYSPA